MDSAFRVLTEEWYGSWLWEWGIDRIYGVYLDVVTPSCVEFF